MPAKEDTLASASVPPESCLPLPNSSVALDTEMTFPLTSVEEHNRSSSDTSEGEIKEMSSYNPNNGGPPGRGRLPNRPPAPAGQPIWRNDEVGIGAPQYGGGYYGAPGTAQQYDPNAPMMAQSHYAPPYGSVYPGPGGYGHGRPRGHSLTIGEQNVPLSTIQPGNLWPTDAQLSTAYAYGIRRDDGKITRLVPADELGNLEGIPQHQGPENLIILPAPRQLSPGRRNHTEVMIPREVYEQLQGNYYQSGPGRFGDTQGMIDSIVASASSASVSPPPQRRREKIYCDKWIHEGVCAFTQMGCKYKHEMPMDKATQISLGLNHGVPNWYRRAYGVNLSSSSPPAPAPAQLHAPHHNPARLEGNWRRMEIANASSGGDSATTGAVASPASAAGSFGPIGPPQSQSATANRYSSLKAEHHDDDDEEEDEITWRGRNN